MWDHASVVQDSFAVPAFALSVISLIVAVIGALTGITSLVWQIVTRTRGAHRVVVRANPNMMLFTGSSSYGPFVQIEVINRGAAAVQIQSWSILLPSGTALMIAIPESFPPSPALPYMLHPGSSVSFYSRASALEEAMEPRDLPKARAVAVLGTGQQIIGKKGELVPRESAEPEA